MPSRYCFVTCGYPHCSCILSFSLGQLKQNEQQQVVEQAVPKEDSSAPTELQPHSLVFTLEDNHDRPSTCEPATVLSSKPYTVGLDTRPPKLEGPSQSKSEEIVHKHQLKETEKQVSLSVRVEMVSTLYNNHFVSDHAGCV